LRAGSSPGKGVQAAEAFFGSITNPEDSAHLIIIPVPSSISRLDVSRRVTEAAAPRLSFLQIAFVGSSNIGWEGITALQSMTSNDHGGAQLRVVTEEIGYGNLPVARFNGSVLANSKNYFTETICWNGSVYVIPCSAGQTIVGYRKYWNLDGYQIGSFSYQNKSTNSPWNTMSDSISIL
jgi:Domain of unknown function (DUF4879)